jgi:RHS repeat-associated protein
VLKAAQILTTTYRDYYPFGMEMPGRSYEAGGYRFGFNGKEQQDEVYWSNSYHNFGARIYNSRIGKFLSVDPYASILTSYTPYQFANNSPISHIDVDGHYAILIPVVVEGITYLLTVITASYVVSYSLDAIYQAKLNKYTDLNDYKHQQRRDKALQDIMRLQALAGSQIVQGASPPGDHDPNKYNKLATTGGVAGAMACGLLDLLHSMQEMLLVEIDNINHDVEHVQNSINEYNIRIQNGEVLSAKESNDLAGLKQRRTILEEELETKNLELQIIEEMEEEEKDLQIIKSPLILQPDQINTQTPNYKPKEDAPPIESPRK